MEGESQPIAVVTGAAQGIGAAVAHRLSADGYALVLVDAAPDVARTVTSIIDAGGRAESFVIDVSRPDQVEGLRDDVSQGAGGVEVLVNNAGIFPRDLVEDLSWSEWKRVLEVNAGGTFLCSKAFRRLLAATGRGRIVNISSTLAITGAVAGAHYAASKAAVRALSRSLAQEWAPDIRVNAVLPGLTDTAQPRLALSDADMDEIASTQIPMRRIATPQDVAAAVSFLVSDDACYITGADLIVNGGHQVA